MLTCWNLYCMKIHLQLKKTETSQESGLKDPEQPVEKTNMEFTTQQQMNSAIEKFENWLLVILFKILQFLVQVIFFKALS